MTFTFHSGAMTSGTIAFAVFILAVMAGVAIALLWLAGGGGAKHPKPWEMLPWPGVLAITFGAVIALLLFALGLAEAFRTLWPVKEPTLASALGLGGGNALGKGALIVALLGAPLVIWGTWLKHRSVSFQQEGHITDRISKAVEQLGAEKVVKIVVGEGEDTKTREESQPNIEVRVGGLLSLQRIAEDSMRYDKGRDHIRVMQIICAYVRQNSPALSLVATEGSFKRKRPGIDIQAAVDVLRKRSPSQIALEHERRFRLDLRETDFDGVSLVRGDFSGAIMFRCRFEAADLRAANLTGAQMQESLLNHADLDDAVLRGTCLDRVVDTGNDYGKMLGNTDLSVSVEGANIQYWILYPGNLLGHFGSSDTLIDFASSEARAQARKWLSSQKGAHRLDIEALVKLAREAGDLPREAHHFLHWNPHTADDLASGMYRKRWRDHHRLHGWPFED